MRRRTMMIGVEKLARKLRSGGGGPVSRSVDLEGSYRPAPTVTMAEGEGVGTLLDLRGGRFLHLGSVGSRIWELLSSGLAPAQVVERLAGEYDAAPERVAADTERFVADLLRRGLLVSR